MLELKDIRLRIGDADILRGISLKLEDKKIYAVTGSNGSGKSSLARVIMGIQQPTSGSVLLDGQDITGLSITDRARLGIGYAFQHPPRFKGIKVKKLMALCRQRHAEGVRLLFSVGLCARLRNATWTRRFPAANQAHRDRVSARQRPQGGGVRRAGRGHRPVEFPEASRNV